MEKNDPKYFKVRVGSSHSNKGGTEYGISDVFVKGANRKTDIGMLKTMIRMKMFKTAPSIYSMPESIDYIHEGRMTYTQGWGRNPNDPNSLSLYKSEGKTISNEDCKMYYERMENSMMCVMGEDDSTPCQVRIIFFILYFIHTNLVYFRVMMVLR
jgi:hypothetical protein